MSRKRTKIVCTIGPACSSPEMLRAMIAAGMNVARLNFSHGTYEDHASLIRTVREAAEAENATVAILQDLQGPKIRAGELPAEGVTLVAGGTVTFTTGKASVAELRLPVTYERLHLDVKPGERILLDDGLMSAKVREIRKRDVICDVVDGGLLTSHKGVNFPDSHLKVSPLSEKDREDLKFGVAQHVDFIALSFVRSASEIAELRALIAEAESAPGFERRSVAPIGIIAKIEKREALEDFEAILKASDGVMIARGDLGIETPVEAVPIVQKRLVARCRAAAKPVIVATQMLDSMICRPRPTRAEVSDIANAVIDHADALMLSGETATGAHPLEAVRVMARVIEQAEASEYDDLALDAREASAADGPLFEVAAALRRQADAKAVAVASMLGPLARNVSGFRPQMPILAASDDPRVCRQLALTWGVLPLAFARPASADEFFERVAARLKELGLAASGDHVIVAGGDPIAASVEVRQLP